MGDANLILFPRTPGVAPRGWKGNKERRVGSRHGVDILWVGSGYGRVEIAV